MVEYRPYIFQIGFNRCATQSLYRALQLCKIKAVHHHFKIDKQMYYIADEMQKNPENPIHEHLCEFEAFLDLEDCYYPNNIIRYYTQFETFYELYEESLFIMNIRPCIDWIKSRIRLGMIPRAPIYYKNITEEKLIEWIDHFFNHSIHVRDFFCKSQSTERRRRFFLMQLGIHSITDVLDEMGIRSKKDIEVHTDFACSVDIDEHLITPNIIEYIYHWECDVGNPAKRGWWGI